MVMVSKATRCRQKARAKDAKRKRTAVGFFDRALNSQRRRAHVVFVTAIAHCCGCAVSDTLGKVSALVVVKTLRRGPPSFFGPVVESLPNLGFLGPAVVLGRTFQASQLCDAADARPSATPPRGTEMVLYPRNLPGQQDTSSNSANTPQSADPDGCYFPARELIPHGLLPFASRDQEVLLDSGATTGTNDDVEKRNYWQCIGELQWAITLGWTH